MSKVLANIFCYQPTFEWILYLIIELALVAFFVVSCYNADRLLRLHDEDTDLRNGLNLAMEIVLIFIGVFLFTVWYKGSISKLQLCFCCHVAIFLVMTGLSTMFATSKRIYLKNNTPN